MGRRCCIAGCSSTSRLPEHHGVTYHSFPLDTSIRAIWLRNTRLNNDRQITKSVLVCSRHFRRVDFQPQRSGKYLLKQRVFPTVFPWGKVDPAQVESDLEDLNNASLSTTNMSNQTNEDATKATVEAKVAQIMAETAERNAAKASSSVVIKDEIETTSPVSTPVVVSPAAVKFEAVTSFNPGTRLEAQDFDGVWHSARVVEVDNDDREVLIKFERAGKMKSVVVGTEEWIPMNSTRLRQKVSTKPIPIFDLEEKCMARWSGPRKFPGTIKKILGNDLYEVLFDDGYVKNVRAVHMTKVLPLDPESHVPISSPTLSIPSTPQILSTTLQELSPLKTTKVESPLPLATTTSSAKKRTPSGSRKDWPLLDLSKLDLNSLNLPEIPRDGEWTCHWVNDQPIGQEGFLIVGEHRKPTVIVEDWRLPPGWVKHMYQRSNVLGKWDVILVTPGGKRFRSKSDLKMFLEEQGQVYNPDIYDFSIHRRRAKDINAYVYTPDYTPQQAPKPKPLDITIAAMDAASVKAAKTALAVSSSQYIETPVATPIPPAELMTPTSGITSKATTTEIAGNPDYADTVSSRSVDPSLPVEDGYAYIGGLKVQIIDNLFRCPQVGCLKNFRKEDHLQIHVKHYHQDLIKLLGSCPKMLELAEKRTHTKPDQHEPAPRNQIPNQQFFAKLHQQDLLQTRAHRRSAGILAAMSSSGPQAVLAATEVKCEADIKIEANADTETSQISVGFNDTSLNSSTQNSQNSTMMDVSITTVSSIDENLADISAIPTKRSRSSPSKRALGARKSNRQRTTRRYLTAAQATSGASILPMVTADSSFGVSDFEETRHSFNATPDAKIIEVGKKRKSSGAPVTPVSSLDSPVTADSGSSSFPPLLGPGSNEAENLGGPNANQPQYIKENGEIIKIVSMRQEEIINCLCSYGEEDGLMIQCELCLCWQHGICNGIDKEVDVPEKYVCYICRNPQRGREAMRFKHDQDWLYDGKLPVANYHIANPSLPKRFEFLQKSHVLTGNLVELKRFMHSLRVKMNIANNRCHPKLYLWAKKWEEDLALQHVKSNLKSEQEIKMDIDIKVIDSRQKTTPSTSPTKKIKSEPTTPSHPIPNIPQPEAPIDPVECQHRLMEHIKIQQNFVLNRLDDIENEMDGTYLLCKLQGRKIIIF
ncbi:PREDICTED: uncharacterized protein LOC108371996 [Rhagoletis zephyria]|uniref:uncharacterized protein LOC108371996 n=1 Tax=Rhagoletis zephyria TaxID=28612 RepID=UPI0008116B7C|nr:PREDICTED: uncharacterized protein LOC108371996 [Rhagoletis zephyria]